MPREFFAARQARTLVERHGGEVPRTMADLSPSEGVGFKRKAPYHYSIATSSGVSVEASIARIVSRTLLAFMVISLLGKSCSSWSK